MIRRRHLLLTLVLGLALATSAPALDVPLKYIQFPERRTEYLPAGNTLCRVQDKAPANVKLPKLVSAQPFYGSFTLAGKETFFVLDRQKKEDANYNRLWVDANGNRDLSDDPPVDSKPALGSLTEFSAINLQVKEGEKSHPFCLRIQAYLPSRGGLLSLFSSPKIDAASVMVIVVSNCAYTGQFTLEGKTWRVAIGDGNCNGTLSDRAKMTYSPMTTVGKHPASVDGDEILLTSRDRFDTADGQMLGTHLALGDKLYRVQLNLPESRMTLTPLTDGLVTLNLPEHTSKLELISEDGKTVIMAAQPGKSITVPAGRYTVATAELTAPDPQGDLWRVTARATAESTPIEARGAAMPASFGPPFRPVAAPEGGMMRTGILGGVSLEFAVLDSAGMVARVEHVSGNKTKIPLYANSRPAAPAYTVTTEDGQKVAQGQFEYG